MPDLDKDYLAGLSREGRGIATNLVASLDSLRAAFAAHKANATAALYAAPDFTAVLDAIDGVGSGVASAGAGPDVPAAEAALTGTMLRVDWEGRVFDVTMAEALKTHVPAGAPFVIAGAGGSLADLLAELPAWVVSTGFDAMIVQFVGIDSTHWTPDKAVPLLEVNLLQAAAAQALNSAMNEVGLHAVVISHGFGCWVASRALLALPLRNVWFARNLHLDLVGPPTALADFVAAKDGGFGSIAHVQGKVARETLSKSFGVPDRMLKSIPVDVGA